MLSANAKEFIPSYLMNEQKQNHIQQQHTPRLQQQHMYVQSQTTAVLHYSVHQKEQDQHEIEDQQGQEQHIDHQHEKQQQHEHVFDQQGVYRNPQSGQYVIFLDTTRNIPNNAF